MNRAIGDRIKSVRRAAGLTQEALSRRTELSLQAVGDIERGVVTDPHISSLRQIADALGVTVSELVEEPEVALAGSSPKAEAPSSPPGPAEFTLSDDVPVVLSSEEDEPPLPPISEPQLRSLILSVCNGERDLDDAVAFVKDMGQGYAGS